MASGKAPRRSWARAGNRAGATSQTSRAATLASVTAPRKTGTARWARSRRVYMVRVPQVLWAGIPGGYIPKWLNLNSILFRIYPGIDTNAVLDPLLVWFKLELRRMCVFWPLFLLYGADHNSTGSDRRLILSCNSFRLCGLHGFSAGRGLIRLPRQISTDWRGAWECREDQHCSCAI